MIPLLLGVALHGALAQEPEAPQDYDRVLHDARPSNQMSFTYPGIAKALRLPPVPCDVELIVGTTGRVEEVRPLKCPNAFAEAATADMMKWRYTPALVKGVPIRFMSPIRVTYTLPEKDFRMITEKSWTRVDRDLQQKRSLNRVLGFVGIGLATGGAVVAGLALAEQAGIEGGQEQAIVAGIGGGGFGLGVALTVAGFSGAGRARQQWELWQYFEP
jgi:hypothetical protein